MRPLVAHGPHGALGHLTSAMSMYEEMAMAFWRDQAGTALARLP